ncbi:MarR family transcriptional regulator [Solirubrobacter taibaiensis]|nr:MarR family transcriptional regulator [Solirubrobacter taibaiensis]
MAEDLSVTHLRERGDVRRQLLTRSEMCASGWSTRASASSSNAAAAAKKSAPDWRLFQQLVEGPRPVGEVAENLGVTSQAISKTARELEDLGYVERTPSPADARVWLLALSGRGRAAVEASRAARAALNAELVATLGTAQVEAAAKTMRFALESRNAMQAVTSRRVRSAQGLPGEGR